jgi:HK97 family phage prohead protease
MTARLEIRDSGSSEWVLEGLASTYDQPYPVRDKRGVFTETIKRGLWASAISGQDEVSLMVEHQAGPPLAPTGRSGTMTLSDSPEGLVLRVRLSKSDLEARSAVDKARRQLLDRLSVGMLVRTDSWAVSSTGEDERTITAAPLAEVSLIHRPANSGAVLTSIRADQTRDGMEVRYSKSGLAVVSRADSACSTCDGTGLVSCPDCGGTSAEECTRTATATAQPGRRSTQPRS